MSLSYPNLTLEELEVQFQAWRNQKKYSRERVPEELWEKAIALTTRYGVALLIKRLNLNYHGFKSRLEKRRLEPPAVIQTESPSAFVAVDVPFSLPSCLPTCAQVEVERVDGTRMRLYAPANQSFDVHSLMNTFLEGSHASNYPTK